MYLDNYEINMNIESKICDYKGNEKDICKIRFEVFVDEQIDKIAQMVFRCDAAAGARFRSQA